MTTIVYHGDDYGTKKLDPKNMYNKHNIGIKFFSNKNTAEMIGKKICSIDIKGLKIVNSEETLSKVVSKEKREKFVNFLRKNCSDSTFEKLEKINVDKIDVGLWQKMLADIVKLKNIEIFVKGWNKIIEIDGLLEHNRTQYSFSIIQTNVKVTPINYIKVKKPLKIKGYIFRGDNRKILKIDPRNMLHEKSNNWYGMGIYFTSYKNISHGYGTYICKLKKSQLKKIVMFDEKLNTAVSQEKQEKFINFLINNCQGFDKKWEEYKEVFYDDGISSWQADLAELAGVNNIIKFIEGWNKIIKIDAFYVPLEKKIQLADEKYDEWVIMNPEIKITPVNF